MLGKFRGWSERIGSTLSNVGRTCVIAPLAIAASVAMAFGTPAAAVAESTSTLPALQHEKTIHDNGDGTYTLSLNVTGASETSVDASPVDVVLVMDISRSMNTADGNAAGDTRLAVAKRAANNLVDMLLTQQNADLGVDKQIQVSVVNFDTYANGSSAFSADASTVKETIDELNPPKKDDLSAKGKGQTNWEAAFREANNVSSNRNAEKYIIFLSDGDPTYRNTSVYKSDLSQDEVDKGRSKTDPDEYTNNTDDRSWARYGDIAQGVHGNGRDDSFGFNFDCAVTEANKRADGVKLFAVSNSTMQKDSDDDSKVVTPQENMENFANKTDSTYYNGSDEEKLNAAFAAIANAITKSSAYSNVKIHDTLSEWAMGVKADGSIAEGGRVDVKTAKYSRSDQEGEWNGAPKLTVDSDGNISWDLSEVDGGTLKNNVTYTVSFLVAPNQRAFDDAALNSKSEYPSNGSAFVSYDVQKTVNGQPSGDPEPGTSEYNKPNMEVKASKLIIKKEWSDNAENFEGDSVTINVTDNKSVFTQTVTLSKDNNWTQELSVASGPEGHTYSIAEQPVAGYATSVDKQSITMSGHDAITETSTVTNTLKTADFTVSKTVAGDAANTDEHFEFTLTTKDAKLFGKEYKLTYTGHETDGDTTKHPNKVTFDSTGNATFGYADSNVKPTNTMPLKHGEHVQIVGLPVGKIVTVTEVNVSNATVISAVKGNANAGANVSKAADKTQTYAVDVTVAEGNSDDVAFTNTTNHAPETGISSDVLPMAGLMATAVIGGSALAMEQRRRAAGKPGSDAWKE